MNEKTERGRKRERKKDTNVGRHVARKMEGREKSLGSVEKNVGCENRCLKKRERERGTDKIAHRREGKRGPEKEVGEERNKQGSGEEPHGTRTCIERSNHYTR